LFLREIFDEVTRECVDEGGLAEVRRPSRSSMARQLREWELRWMERLSDGDADSLPVAEQFMDQLVIVRFLCENVVRAGVSTQPVECMRALLSGGVPEEGLGPEVRRRDRDGREASLARGWSHGPPI